MQIHRGAGWAKKRKNRLMFGAPFRRELGDKPNSRTSVFGALAVLFGDFGVLVAKRHFLSGDTRGAVREISR